VPNIGNNSCKQRNISKQYIQPPISGDNSTAYNLDTLAHLDQKIPNKLEHKVLAKYLTTQILLPLIDQNSPLKKAYWNTYHCTNILIQQGQKLTASYCKNRWCIVCNRIRTATLMNGYLEQIKEFKNGAFVTLTRPNVVGADLRSEIDSIVKLFGLIQRKAKRLGYNHTALRKLECTYSSRLRNYNPHLHVICSNMELATFIRKEWLKRNLNAYKGAQDIQPLTEHSAKELFKYFTKLITISKQRDNRGIKQVELNARALDTILQSIRNKRTFQTYGDLRLISEDIEDIESQEYPSLTFGINIWKYNPIIHNYVSQDSEIIADIEPHRIYGIKVVEG
jgi:hypothetical protein